MADSQGCNCAAQIRFSVLQTGTSLYTSSSNPSVDAELVRAQYSTDPLSFLPASRVSRSLFLSQTLLMEDAQV